MIQSRRSSRDIGVGRKEGLYIPDVQHINKTKIRFLDVFGWCLEMIGSKLFTLATTEICDRNTVKGISEKFDRTLQRVSSRWDSSGDFYGCYHLI